MRIETAATTRDIADREDITDLTPGNEDVGSRERRVAASGRYATPAKHAVPDAPATPACSPGTRRCMAMPV